MATREQLDRAYALQQQAAEQAQADAASAQAAAAAEYDRTRSRTLGEVGQDAAIQTLQGAVGLGQATYGLVNGATLGGLDALTGMSKNFQQTNQILSEAKSAPTQARIQDAQQAFDNDGIGAGLKAYVTSPALLQDVVVSNLASVLPGAAVARAAGVAAKGAAVAQGLDQAATGALVREAAEKAVVRGTAAQTFGSNNVDATNQIRDAGGSQLLQAAGGVGAGLIAGAAGAGIAKITGAAGLEGAAANLVAGGPARGLPGVISNGGLLSSIAGGVAKEATEETLQSGSEQLAQNIVTPGKNLWDGVGQQAAIGGLGGALLGGAFGGVAGASSPRTPSPLRDAIGSFLSKNNTEQGSPLTNPALDPSDQNPLTNYAQPLAESDIPAENNIDVGATPVPDDVQFQQGEAIDIGATPAPDESINLDLTPSPDEHVDVGAAPLPQADLFGQTLPAEGAYPTTSPAPELPQEAPATPDAQQSIRFDSPVGSWKSTLAKQLGLKPGNLSGKAWQQFSAAAEAANVHPNDPNAARFLAEQADAFAADPATAKEFEIRMKEQFATGNAPVEAVETAPTVLPTDEAPAAVGTPRIDAYLDREAVRAAEYQARAEKRNAALALDNSPVAPVVEQRTAVDNAVAAVNPEQVVNNAVATAAQDAADRVVQQTATIQPAEPQGFIREAAEANPRGYTQDHTTRGLAKYLSQAQDIDDLEARYGASTQTPEFQALDSLGRRLVDDHFDAHSERFSPGKFQRAEQKVEPAQAMGTQQFASMVANANSVRTGNESVVVPLESVADFTALTGHPAPSDARGVFVDGKTYLIRENLSGPKDLVTTLAHERGHQGLDKLLGAWLNPVLNRLWTNASLRPRIQAKMKAMSANGDIDPAKGSQRRAAAEEVLADMFAGKEKVGNDILSKIRSAVDNGIAKALGYDHLRMSNADVNALMTDVGRVLSRQGAVMDYERPQYQGIIDLAAGDVTATNPKFSQAAADLEVSTSDQATPKPRYTINSIAKDAVNSFTGLYHNTAVAINRGGGKGYLADFAPLNWLAKYYENEFTTAGGENLIGKIDLLNVYKEGAYAQQLAHPTEYSFEGEKFQTSPQQLAAEWHKFNQRAPQSKDKLSALLNDATLYKVWPNKTWEEQTPLNYGREGFTEAERRAAYDTARQRYKQLGVDGQAIFKKTQAIARAQYNRYFKALGTEYTTVSGHKPGSPEFNEGIGNLVGAALKRIEAGPYASLQRTGEYLVTVRNADGTQWLSGHDTQAQAETAAADLRENAYADPSYSINVTGRKQFDMASAGIDAQTATKLRRLVEDLLPGEANEGRRTQLSDGLMDLYLSGLPDRSYLQHSNSRKGTKGYGTDALRSFSDYSLKNALRTSNLEYDGQIRRTLGEMDQHIADTSRGQGDTNTSKLVKIRNAVGRQIDSAKVYGSSPVPTLMSRLGFLKFMTSPSQALINSLQTFNITMPKLAGEYGFADTQRELRRAMADFVKSKGSITGDKTTVDPNSVEGKAMAFLANTSQLDASFAHDLVQVASGDAAKLYGVAGDSMKVLSMFMHQSEKFNRHVSALAAARLEAKGMNIQGAPTDEQVQQVALKALDALRTTHGDYSASNSPAVMGGPWRRMFFQFQKYRLNMLAMLGKEFRDALPKSDVPLEQRQAARRTLAYLVGTQLAFTGVAGSLLAPVVFGIMDAFRDDDDLLDSREEFLRAYPQWLTQGLLSSAFGVDLGRVGMNTLLPVIGDSVYAPNTDRAQDTATYYLMQNLGPWTGLITDGYAGASAAIKGDAMGAMKGLAPKPIADLYKATMEGMNGARDARQVTYFEPDLWDTVTGALGLRSTDRREAEGLRSAAYDANTNLATQRKRYLTQLAVAHATSDFDLQAQARQSIQDWNQKYTGPGERIGASDIRSAIISRVRAQTNADQFGIASSRAPGVAVKQALGL